MMRFGWAVLLAAAPLAAQFDHSAWDRVLKKSTNVLGEVDYGALKKDRKDLDDYVRRLSEMSPDSKKDAFPTREAALAYWLNAYNALVMRAVVDAYPTKSVRDLGLLYGFFRRKDHTLGGTKISLLALENDIIRPRFNDARIHFAIVCASISCPLLDREAFQPDTVDTHRPPHAAVPDRAPEPASRSGVEDGDGERAV